MSADNHVGKKVKYKGIRANGEDYPGRSIGQLSFKSIYQQYDRCLWTKGYNPLFLPITVILNFMEWQLIIVRGDS